LRQSPVAAALNKGAHDGDIDLHRVGAAQELENLVTRCSVNA